MERLDTVVIGAGVVGLAVARALALSGRDVLVVERHETFGTETSSRNSEVIHAGLYYRPGGLRAKLCVPGKAMLYRYCRERHIPHENCEKLIVAHGHDERLRLAALKLTASKNGVHDLVDLDADDVATLEPGLVCDAALLSPTTGIIDSHTLMLSLLGDVEEAGGVIAFSTPLLSGCVKDDAIALRFGGIDPMALEARVVVNCAGLCSDQVGLSIAGLSKEFIPAIHPAKGQYFSYAGKAPFQRLVYPLHTKDSQGVHYTRDLGGQARLGPDISWGSSLGNYVVEESRKQLFVDGARRFWPDIDVNQLQPAYAGARPKASMPGEEGDFLIVGPNSHGTPGYIGLYAIESPGLTSCLAIGGYVAAMVSVG